MALIQVFEFQSNKIGTLDTPESKLAFSQYEMGEVINPAADNSLRQEDVNVATKSAPLEWKTAKKQLSNGRKLTKKVDKLPNILYILSDDLGHNDLSGNFLRVPTPNIDSIKNNGISFTSAYTGSATCAPSRAATFTGRFPTEIGWEFTPFPREGWQILSTAPAPIRPIYHSELYNTTPNYLLLAINKKYPHMAHIIKERFGYKNYFMGKWDSGVNQTTHSPRQFGFDESLCFQRGAALFGNTNDPNIVTVAGGPFAQLTTSVLSFAISHNDGPSFTPNEYMTDYLATQTNNLIKTLKDSNDPWHISLNFNSPHFPYQALLTDFNDARVSNITNNLARVLGAMIFSLDRAVGNVLDTLRTTGQLDNTIVIFTSDNGGPDYEGIPGRNAPYRGWKSTFFEGGIRVPYYVQWPKVFPAGGITIDDPIMQMDLLPSALALPFIAKKNFNPNNIPALRHFESESREGLTLSGESIWSKVFAHTNRNRGDDNNSDEENSKVFAQTDRNHGDDNNGQYDPQGRFMFWRSGHYKVARQYGYKISVSESPDALYFYHITEDPVEANNLAVNIGITTHSDLRALVADESLAASRFSDDESRALFNRIAAAYNKLMAFDAVQHKPDYPGLIETGQCIDKPFGQCNIRLPHVFYPN